MKGNMISKTAMVICAAVLIAAVAFGAGNSNVWSAGYQYDNAGKYTAGGTSFSKSVKNLDVDWIDGKVDITYEKGNVVTVSEKTEKKLSKDQELRWWLDGETLRIRYAKQGLHLNWNLKKELTITLPEGIILEDVDISATSGTLSIPAMEAENLSLDVTSGEIYAAANAGMVPAGATSGDIELYIGKEAQEIEAGATSGSILIEAADAGQVKVDTTSGEIRVDAGNVGNFHADSTSGKICAKIGEVKEADLECTSGGIDVEIAKLGSLNIDSTSGDVMAALPEKPGFTARLDVTSGDVRYDLPLTKEGSVYICGDGSGSVEISTTSGDIRIK